MASFASRALRRYLHAQRGYARDVAAWTVEAGEPICTGWSAAVKTMGIVVVAAFTASTPGVLAKITAT
jgi:hypothetical protein